MRLLCPFCTKTINVPDSESGKPVNCPECGQAFAAPQIVSPATPAPAPAPKTMVAPSTFPVPEPVPETHAPTAAEPLTAATDQLPRSPGSAWLPLEPAVVKWIPVAALGLAFIMTFFSWNGLYPAGYPAYTQSAWGGLFGGVGYDSVAEDEMKSLEELRKRVKSSWWLLPYLALLLPTLALAAAGPIVSALKVKLPPQVESLWQYRPALLGILAAATLLFLLAQWASGFALQKAVNEIVEERFAEGKAEANTPEKMQRWEMRVSSVKAAYQVRTTPWLRLAVMFHLIAVAAVVAEAGLALRGNKPPPRLGVTW